MAPTTPKTCPRCSSEDTVPIVYGYPGPKLTEPSIRGEVVLGGCMVWPDAPDYTCKNCGHEWREHEALENSAKA